MLIINRKIGERIYIGEDIIIEVLDADERKGKGKAEIGIGAPKHISIDREEVRDWKALGLNDRK